MHATPKYIRTAFLSAPASLTPAESFAFPKTQHRILIMHHPMRPQKNSRPGTKRSAGILAATVLLAAIPVAGHAGDLFSITATDGVLTRTAGSKSVTDLVSDLINTAGPFNGLASIQNSSLTYAGVANAMRFTENAAGTTATLIIPSIGFNRVFNGVNSADLENQIDAFLKKDGADVLAQFLKSMNQRSLVSVTDGNPNSATARAASQSFSSYGMTDAETQDEKENPDEGNTRSGFGMIADVGTIDANGIKGQVYSLPLYARFKLSKRVGLNFDIPLSYADIEGSTIFGFGLGVAVPIKAIPRTKDSPWYWQITPFGGANVSGSADFAAGGMLANGGIVSLLAHDFGKMTLSMGNQLSIHEGIPITVGDYKFDPGVSQQIIKNGLKLDVPFARRWVFDLYGIHTKFVEDAAVDQYFTVGAGIGYKRIPKPGSAKKSTGYIKVGLYADVGSDYTSAHAHFGTGWKF